MTDRSDDLRRLNTALDLMTQIDCILCALSLVSSGEDQIQDVAFQKAFELEIAILAMMKMIESEHTKE